MRTVEGEQLLENISMIHKTELFDKHRPIFHSKLLFSQVISFWNSERGHFVPYLNVNRLE